MSSELVLGRVHNLTLTFAVPLASQKDLKQVSTYLIPG